MIDHKYLYFLLAIIFLSGCTPGGSTELPSERPFGTISGNAVDGLIVGAQVSIYSLRNGSRGIKLGEATTDDTGAYSVDIQSPNQPILIEVNGGSYIEEATGTPVALKDGQVLRAVGLYRSGQTHNFMVTPLTHLITALVDYKVSIGMSVESAFTEASSTVNQFFSLDVGGTRPLDITNENSAVTAFGDEALYGFYLAGLSDWSLWASNENNEPQPHTIYTSIAMSQVLYHDLHSDGLLNGIGFNQAGTELEQLGFGTVPLNEDAYRLAFSLHMLAIANSAKNKTGFVVADLLDAANSIAAQTDLLLGASSPVDIDNQAPTFNNNTGTHSQARFSNGDGTYTETPLEDINDAAALYFETDNIDLGSVLISRTTLDNNAIPYFAFGVSDQMELGISTDPQDLTVRVQYRRNNIVLNPWRSLAPIGDEYLIPLASETLSPDWHQSTPSDEHLIAVEVTDAAGNQTIRNFSFRADFYVPALTIDNNITDLGAEIFSATAFIDRDDLNDMQFASTAYTFTNTTGKSFYINLSDDSLHTTTQTVEQLVREHLAHVKTTTEWRVGLMTPTDNCPELTSWTPTSSVWNWNGIDWVEEYAPLPSDGAEENIFEEDVPSDPTPSAWSDVPDFDNFLEIGFSGNSLTQKTYSYDYKLDSGSDEAAYVSDWTLRDSISREVLQTCPRKRYFQQREVYRYESVSGYPTPVLSTVTLSDTPEFSTISYAVMDNDTGLELVPVNGWYQIPVGHSISIQKWVATPNLTLHNDDISDVSSFPSYTPSLYDMTMTWSVARNLNMSLVHDSGEENIPLMPVRNITVGEGAMNYLITR